MHCSRCWCCSLWNNRDHSRLGASLSSVIFFSTVFNGSLWPIRKTTTTTTKLRTPGLSCFSRLSRLSTGPHLLHPLQNLSSYPTGKQQNDWSNWKCKLTLPIQVKRQKCTQMVFYHNNCSAQTVFKSYIIQYWHHLISPTSHWPFHMPQLVS